MSYAQGGKQSSVVQSISALGKTLGVGMAILVTPGIYNRTKVPMFSYLSEAWGHDIGKWLTWAMAGVEAFALYTATSLIFTSVVVTLIARAAARSFSGE